MLSLNLYICSWLAVFGLYLLGLSSRLQFSFNEISTFGSAILLSFALPFVLLWMLVPGRKRLRLEQVANLSVANKQWITYCYYLLLAISAFEFFVEGFVPILSKIRGNEISHFDFGIPSVHGLVLAGHLALGTFYFLLYISTSQKKYLVPVLVAVIYAVCVVSRKVFIVLAVQCAIILLASTKINYREIAKLAITGTLVVIIFGVVGDIRSGDVIQERGNLKENAIFKVPGASWVYLYLTTPLENLLYSIKYTEPENNVTYKRTLGSVIPTFVGAMQSEAAQYNYAEVTSERYWLASEVFNISTAYIGPYLDNGWRGIMLFNFLAGIVTAYFSRRANTIAKYLIFIMFSSSAVLTVYSNNYLVLNVLGQIIWFVLITHRLDISRMSLVVIGGTRS